MRPYYAGTLRRALLWLPLWCTVAVTFAQDADRDVLVRNWDRSSTEQRISAISAALSSTSKESRALALSGVARLALMDRATAQRLFPASSVRPHLQDTDPDVVGQAARAYVTVSDSDEAAETEIVAVATSGRSPLRQWEYIRYLRPNGITSDAADKWLTSLALGPVSEDKFSAVEALVIAHRMPPAWLLPHVMELIRSPKYFCALNLVLSLEKFGSPASNHVEELVNLRAKLEVEAKLPVDDRSVVLWTEFAIAAPEIDRVIATLKR